MRRNGELTMQTASSASLTWKASRSASENTATVLMFNRFAVRIIRTAISPLFRKRGWGNRQRDEASITWHAVLCSLHTCWR
jgi:hypothetical protein